MKTNRFATARNADSSDAFTLVEMLVSIAVLTLFILIVTGMVNSTATVTRIGNKHIDTDTEARIVFDRLAQDFGQMLKRTDVDYYLKADVTKYPGHSGEHRKNPGGGGPGGQTDLNDYIAFYSQVTGYSSGTPSPISLLAYRVNGLSTSAAYNQLERRAEGLLWNGISNLNVNNPNPKPMFFLPVQIKTIWSAVTNNTTDPNRDKPYLETIGPHVFRFEYYYLLKSGKLTDTPWDTDAGHTSLNGFADVESIGVTIAVIDPQSRSLLVSGDPLERNLLNLQAAMDDFRTAPGRGIGAEKNFSDVEYQWNQVITDPTITANMPRAAVQAIRIYSRNFDLKPF
jgi:competence protein ComGC